MADNAFAQKPVITLTVEQTKEALLEVEQLLADPANQAKLEGAKTASGGDPMMMMMLVMPIAVGIMSPVLVKYGFPVDQQGGMQFLAAAGSHKENPEIVAKADEIKSRFIPPELVQMAQMFMGGGAPPM